MLVSRWKCFCLTLKSNGKKQASLVIWIVKMSFMPDSKLLNATDFTKATRPESGPLRRNSWIYFLSSCSVLGELWYQKLDKNLWTLKNNDIIMVTTHSIIFIALDILCHGAKLKIIRTVPYLEINGSAEMGEGRLLSGKGGGPQGNYGLTKAHLL